jgi:hypothetical protein
MSATTIAVAVTQDTVAALPPPDFELAMNSPRTRAPITAFLGPKLNDCLRFSPPEYPSSGLHDLQNRIRYMNFI